MDYFLDVLEQEAKKKKDTKQTIFKLETSDVAGQMALWYEKVRTAVQYKEEHLLRRTAMYRILKRLILFEQRRKKREITMALFVELVLAGYLQNKDANDDNFEKTEKIVQRHLKAIGYLGKLVKNPAESMETRRWLINLLSEEIESLINPQREKMAFIFAVYETLRQRINFILEKPPFPLPGSKSGGLHSVAEEYLGVGSLVEPIAESFSPSEKVEENSRSLREKEKILNLVTYLAIFRNLRRSDRVMLRSLIFNVYFPAWNDLDPLDDEKIHYIMKKFLRKRREIGIIAEHPLVPRILFPVKKYMLCSSFLFDALIGNPKEARSIVSQEFLLHQQIREKCNVRYAKEKGKLRKRIIRGFIYVFLTKMLVAIILEIPYEYLKSTGGVQYRSLLINLLFPPFLLTAIASSARQPSEENTKEIIKGVETLVYKAKQEEELREIRVTDRESAWAERILDLFYVIVFVGMFFLLIKLLNILDFNAVAAVIFVIFAGTVSFFGALIRQSTRDLVITKDKEGFFSLVFDTVLLPFVRFGRLLSVKFSRINVFIFLLDFLIEAPFKFIIRAFEAWIDFLRRKRDEIERQID